MYNKNLVFLFMLMASIVVASESSGTEAIQTLNRQSFYIKGIVEPRATLKVNQVSFVDSCHSLCSENNQHNVEITELSNMRAGYIVRLESLNSARESFDTPFLVNNREMKDYQEYKITYEGNVVIFNNGLPLKITDCTGRIADGDVTKLLTIDYSIASRRITEGKYSDTLVLIIEAK